MNTYKQLSIFLLFVILILIILNIIYNKPTELFQDNSDSNSNISNNSFVNESSNNTVILDPNSSEPINNQINTQNNLDNFNNKPSNKEDIEINNKIINEEIKNTIIEQEIEAEELLNQEEIFGKDEVDDKVPLETPNNLLKDSQNFKNMFQKLDDAEYLCNNLERRQKLKNNLEQIKINELAMKELDKQDTQIQELKDILKSLRIEETRRNRISSKCNNEKQKVLNDNYEVVKKLVSDGVLPKKNTQINFNLPKMELLDSNGKLNLKSFKNLPNKINSQNTGQPENKCKTSCSNIDTKKMIHKDKLANNNCFGCNKKILDNKNIIKNFQ